MQYVMTWFNTVLKRNFQEKFKKFVSNKDVIQMLLEYKHMIQSCKDIHVWDLLLLCWVING